MLMIPRTRDFENELFLVRVNVTQRNNNNNNSNNDNVKTIKQKSITQQVSNL